MISFLQPLSSKNLLILAMVALVLVSNGALTWGTLEGASERVSLTEQMADASLALRRLQGASNVEGVQAELAAAQAELKESSFPQQMPSVDVISLLVQAAQETGVELKSLQILASEQEKVGSANYAVLRQRVQLGGAAGRISAFLDRIEKGGFRTLVINNLAMSPQGNLWNVTVDMYLYSAYSAP